MSDFFWKGTDKTIHTASAFTTTSNECVLDLCFLNGDAEECILKNKVINDSIKSCVLKNGIGIALKVVPNTAQHTQEDVKIFLLKLNSKEELFSLQNITFSNTHVDDFKLYMRIIGDPNTLTGEYHVKIHEEAKKHDGIFFKPLFEYTKNVISKSSKNISDALSSSPILQRVFLTIVSIYVSLSGFLFSTGILNHKASDLLKHYLKICCICALADIDTITYLIDLARTLCIDGSQAIADMIIDVSIKISRNILQNHDMHTSMLEVYDEMLASYLSLGFHKRLWSLLFTKYIIYIPIAYITVCAFIMTCIRSAILYLISIVGFSLLFAISPIMLCLLFSKPSKDLFNAWTRCITNCALINIFLSIALGIFAVVLFQYNTSPFEYIICNDPLKILHSPFFSYSIDLWRPYNSISITIIDIITDLLVISLFKYTIDSIPSMVESIAPSIYNPLSDAGNVIYNVTNMAEIPISAPSFAAYHAYKYTLSKASTSILNIISRKHK